MASLVDAVIELVDFGLLDVVLPFLLSFTIIFAMLQKTKVLGKGAQGRKNNAIVAFVVGLIFVNLFAFRSFMGLILWMVFLLIAVIMYILLIETVGLKRKANKCVVLFIFGLFLLIVSHNFIDLSRFFSFVFNPIVITILVFFLMIRFIMGETTSIKCDDDDDGKTSKTKDRKDDKKDKPRDKDQKIKDNFDRQPTLIKSIPGEKIYESDEPGTIWDLDEER